MIGVSLGKKVPQGGRYWTGRACSITQGSHAYKVVYTVTYSWHRARDALTDIDSVSMHRDRFGTDLTNGVLPSLELTHCVFFI